MHKSRLGVVVIDCRTDDLAGAAAFWGAALGCPAEDAPGDGDENYVKLQTQPDEVGVLLQKVDHPGRVHLDIETDDVEAEVKRLEELGAKRVAQIKTWWVMEAPTGQRFCVVNPQRPDFERGANVWE